MIRAPARNGAAPRRPGEEDDICPVCKSSRYLNPNMRFLVNPECYHKMCESCVDRIFSQGPAPCPVAGCARTLRKQRFRKQTFDDIHIEREVDIRRRVAQVSNRRQSEFATLLDYNNYLEEVETLTFNLLYNIDVPATESLLAAHAAQNAPAISRNALLSGIESTTADQAPKREEDSRSRARDQDRRDRVDKDAASAAGKDATDAAQKVVLKKSTARRTARALPLDPSSSSTTTTATDASTFAIKGLLPVSSPPPPSPPYDPFGGIRIEPAYHHYYDNNITTTSSTSSQPTTASGAGDASRYSHPWLERACADTAMLAGGFDAGEYYRRAMTEAFAGLGCFVAE